MLEIIKEAGTILKDLPELAIWILVGILFYKIFIIGGAFSLARFAISKLHSFMTEPKRVVTEISLSDRFICFDGTHDRFLSFLDKVVEDNGGKFSPKGKYLHGSDVDMIEKAYTEYKNKDKK